MAHTHGLNSRPSPITRFPTHGRIVTTITNGLVPTTLKGEVFPQVRRNCLKQNNMQPTQHWYDSGQALWLHSRTMISVSSSTPLVRARFAPRDPYMTCSRLDFCISLVHVHRSVDVHTLLAPSCSGVAVFAHILVGLQYLYYHVHKTYLAVGPRKSEYFASLFRSQIKETTTNASEITLQDNAADAIPLILDFMYAKEYLSISVAQAMSLQFLAQCFAIKRLRRNVTSFVQSNMTMDIRRCHFSSWPNASQSHVFDETLHPLSKPI
jgi:hypothetical protein